MIDYVIQVNGADSVALSLRKLENLDEVIAGAMGQWATKTLDGQLYGEDKYPPPPAGSRYIRTGNLGRGWGVMRSGKTSVQFFNGTPYGPYVVGDSSGSGQAGIHAGRWWIALKRVEEQVDSLGDQIEQAVARLI